MDFPLLWQSRWCQVNVNQDKWSSFFFRMSSLSQSIEGNLTQMCLLPLDWLWRACKGSGCDRIFSVALWSAVFKLKHPSFLWANPPKIKSYEREWEAWTGKEARESKSEKQYLNRSKVKLLHGSLGCGCLAAAYWSASVMVPPVGFGHHAQIWRKISQTARAFLYY